LATCFCPRDAFLLGVQYAREGTVALRRGRIEGHPVGINAQTPSLDPRDAGECLDLDNVRNLDTTELPPPSIGLSAGSL
jgi:hypothetical protein